MVYALVGLYLWAGFWVTVLCHGMAVAVDAVERPAYARTLRVWAVPLWVLLWLPLSVLATGAGVVRYCSRKASE